MAGGERIPNAKRGYHDNHAAEMLVSRQTKKKLQNLFWWIFISAKSPPRSPPSFTAHFLPLPLPYIHQPHLQLSDSGFLAFSWSNPSEQYWTSHSIQTSFYHIFLFRSSYFWLFLLFSILLRLHPVHSLSAQALQGIKVLFSFSILKLLETLFPIDAKKPKTATFQHVADCQCTAMQHSFPAPWLFSLSSVLCVCFGLVLSDVFTISVSSLISIQS